MFFFSWRLLPITGMHVDKNKGGLRTSSSFQSGTVRGLLGCQTKALPPEKLVGLQGVFSSCHFPISFISLAMFSILCLSQSSLVT